MGGAGESSGGKMETTVFKYKFKNVKKKEIVFEITVHGHIKHSINM